MKLTKQIVLKDISALPENYKTKDIDALISEYVRNKADASELRDYVLTEQRLHRIYYYVSLKQIKDVNERMAFIDRNLLFDDWWHTDQLINFVNKLPFETALRYAKKYIRNQDPFIRRWGYVLFISKLGRGHSAELLPLMHDDEHYYVQMGEAWLIAELAIDEPDKVWEWMKTNGLKYNINGKGIQKICDSFRITDEWKAKFKELRAAIKNN
ncbi:MAG: DNA alkylation repair protein [Ruminococcus sp.]|nr:DNA alkylation repair protein [Ruminococcus sp.]